MWAPAQLCRIAEQEQVVEGSHEVQLEEVSEGEAVDGSGLVCLRQLPSLCQREDSRGLSWLWSLFMIVACFKIIHNLLFVLSLCSSRNRERNKYIKFQSHFVTKWRLSEILLTQK